MCVCGCFPTPTSNSCILARCPRIQLNSDTTYPEIEWDSTGKGLSPTRPPSTWDTSTSPSLLPVLLAGHLKTGGLNNPLQLRLPIRSPGCHLHFWPTGSKSEVPTTPSLGSINLLEQLTELRETFYLLDYWFIIKGYNSGTARLKRCIGQSKGKGLGVSTPSPSLLLPPNLHVFTYPEAFRTPSFGFLWKLHHTGMID